MAKRSQPSKLFSILQTFSAWELRNLREMLVSPCYNRQEAVVTLFDRLVEVLKAEMGEPTLREMYEWLFAGTEFEHQRLRYVMTDLVRLTEQFLIRTHLDGDEALRNRILMSAYEGRQLDKYFGQTLKKSLQQTEKQPLRDNQYLYERFRLEEAGLNFDQQRRNRSGDEWIYPMLEDLQLFSLATRLKYVCEMVNRRNVLSVELDQQIIDDVMAELARRSYAEIPAISIYHTILLTLLESEEEAHYRHLRRLLSSNAHHFRLEELGQMYAFALNYCIKQLNSGRTEYLRELFHLYQDLIASKVIYDTEGGHLFPEHFKNIVTVGIRLEEYAWTAAFIQDYHCDIAERDRENAYVYNMASLEFARKEYGKARRLLQQVEFTDVFYQLDSKSLLLKSYYELGDFEPLLSLIDSFKLYLRRNKTISEYQRRVYLNLVKFVRKLVRVRLGSRKPVAEIAKAVAETREIADLRWLEGKIKELVG